MPLLFIKMLQPELILDILTPLTGEASIQQALDMMEEYKLDHIPLVDDQGFHGLISEQACLEVFDAETTLNKSGITPILAFVYQDRHMFDVVKLFGDFKVSMLPVLSLDDAYMGFIDPLKLVHSLSSIFSVESPGSVLVLRVNNNDFHLSQIAQIVESGDAKILMSYLTTSSTTSQIEVTLKINRTDLTPIIKTFERYSYEIVAKFHQSQGELDLKFRYENLMKYLNM